VIQRGEDLVFTYNTVEDAELLELNLWEGGTVAHNASRRAAGTAALGSFGVGDGYHLRDLDFIGATGVGDAGLVIRNEGCGLSGFKVERIRIAQNTIAPTSTTADPSSYLLNIGVFTGATSGTGNVRRDIEIEDNLFYVAPDLAPRTAPAVFLNAPEATPQPFERLEFVGNRIVGPRTGDWSVDIRGAKDATIARSQIRGAVTYGMALTEPQGSRIEDNNAQGVKFQPAQRGHFQPALTVPAQGDRRNPSAARLFVDPGPWHVTETSHLIGSRRRLARRRPARSHVPCGRLQTHD
jgi:hypothetical protein